MNPETHDVAEQGTRHNLNESKLSENAANSRVTDALHLRLQITEESKNYGQIQSSYSSFPVIHKVSYLAFFYNF